MAEDKYVPISVTALRAEDYSPDGKNIIISLTTKYSASERKYSVPVESFHDFITDLKRLSSVKSAAATEASGEPAAASKAVQAHIERDQSISESENTQTPPLGPTRSNESA